MKRKSTQKKDIFPASISPHKGGLSWRRVGSWLAWGVFYLVVFYLGNLSGEYVAAHMPIGAFALPKIALRLNMPKISIGWNGAALSKLVPQPTADTSNTGSKIVIVDGKLITVPGVGATDKEKQDMVSAVGALAVSADTIKIAGACDLAPAFIKIKSGAAISVVNGSSTVHSMVFNTQNAQRVEAGSSASVTLGDTSGAYPISCDGQIVGFYMVQN